MSWFTEEEKCVIPERRKVGSVVVAEIPTNPDCRRFSFRVPIAGYCNWNRHSGWSIDPENRPATVVLLTEVSGIESLLLSTAYELLISKGAAFEWNEIEPQVIKILEFHNGVTQ